MDVVEMVLGGRVNKGLVTLIQQAGANAVGLCGKDSGTIKARQVSAPSPPRPPMSPLRPSDQLSQSPGAVAHTISSMRVVTLREGAPKQCCLVCRVHRGGNGGRL